jgi:oligosaccharide repeat unit polymerase
MRLWFRPEREPLQMNESVVLYLLLAFSLFLIACPMVNIWRRRGDIFEPVFLVSLTFFMYFWLRCVYALIWGTPLLGTPPFQPDTIEAWNITWLYLILAFVLFLSGYYCRIGVKLAGIFARLPATWSSARAKVVVPGMLMIGLGFFAALVHMFGGLSYFLSHKVETFMTRGTGPFFMLSLLGVIFSAECVFIFYLIRPRRALLIAFGVLLILMMGVGCAIGIKGGGIVFPLFSMLVTYHYLKKRLKIRHLVLFVALIVMVFPIFVAQRATTDMSLMLPLARQGYAEPLLMLGIFLGRFMGFDPLVYAIRYTPILMNYQYGRSMLDLFVAWIPQKLWPNKPVYSFGRVFPQVYFGQDENCSTVGPTILGEAYINFHVFGIIFVSLISGILFRAMYVGLIERHHGPSGVFVYAMALPYLAAFWEYCFVSIPPVIIIIMGALLASSALSVTTIRKRTTRNNMLISSRVNNYGSSNHRQRKTTVGRTVKPGSVVGCLVGQCKEVRQMGNG